MPAVSTVAPINWARVGRRLAGRRRVLVRSPILQRQATLRVVGSASGLLLEDLVLQLDTATQTIRDGSRIFVRTLREWYVLQARRMVCPEDTYRQLLAGTEARNLRLRLDRPDAQPVYLRAPLLRSCGHGVTTAGVAVIDRPEFVVAKAYYLV